MLLDDQDISRVPLQVLRGHAVPPGCFIWLVVWKNVWNVLFYVPSFLDLFFWGGMMQWHVNCESFNCSIGLFHHQPVHVQPSQGLWHWLWLVRSIIPQDPFLFAGDLRDNLDPFGMSKPAEHQEALKRAGLKVGKTVRETCTKQGWHVFSNLYHILCVSWWFFSLNTFDITHLTPWKTLSLVGLS